MTMHYDPRFIVQILQFLWSIYSSRRAQSKSRGDKQPEDASAQVPDPDKLQELIEEVKAKPTSQDVATAIDKRFPPVEALQVKEDLTTFAVLVSPPNFADYDFFGAIEKYSSGLHAVASRADLFRLRGSKVDIHSGIRMLFMPSAALALAPADKTDIAVHRFGDIAFAGVKEWKAILLDGSKNSPPLALLAEGVFKYASYGGYSGQRTERAVQAYKLVAGQERNWLEFSFDEGNFPHRSLGFQGFEYRLNGSDVKAIIAALKADIVSYLRELEQEIPVLQELRDELDGLSRIVQIREG